MDMFSSKMDLQLECNNAHFVWLYNENKKK